MTETFDLVRGNLLSPAVLAFVLGIIAVGLRSDLRYPDGLSSTLSLYLLLAIGLRGGHELSLVPLGTVAAPALATLALGIIVPVIAYLVLRRLGRIDTTNAAAIAAHYGSVSAVTFSASLTLMDALKIAVEPFMAVLVVLLESPAIIIAIAIAKAQAGGGGSWRSVLHEVLTGKSVLLLLGGLAIGYLSGDAGFKRVAPVFDGLFQGALMLFLLELGMVAARRLADFRQVGPFLAGFALVMPVLNGALGVLLGTWAGLSLGGTTVLGVLAASASYIAAPAAVRLALPSANPSWYLTASVGITFPFNLTIGIPLYLALARLLHSS